MLSDVTNPPARPARLRTLVERSEGRILISNRSRSWSEIVFLSLICAAWSVACLFLVFAALTKQELFIVLFGIPFWAAWLLLVCALVYAIFGTEDLVLDEDGVWHCHRVIVPMKERRVPVHEIKVIDQYTKVVDSESGRTERGIAITTLGHSIRCFQGLASDELDWLEAELNAKFLVLRRTEPQALDRPANESKGPLAIVLAAEDREVSAPSDCAWNVMEDFDEVSFVKQGRFSLSTIFGLAFVNAFWNGIVSVFLASLLGMDGGQNLAQDPERWGLLVFLLPFMAIGLFMFVAFLAAIAEPLHRTTWTFARDEIQLRHTWLRLGRHWSWQVDVLHRIELRKEVISDNGNSPGKMLNAALGGPWEYRLVLIDTENREVCSIKNVTEGEARWIGQFILAKHASCFR